MIYQKKCKLFCWITVLIVRRLFLIIWLSFRVFSTDHSQLDAQIPASVSHCESQRHSQTAVQHLQDLRVPWNGFHCRDCVPKWQGKRNYGNCSKSYVRYFSKYIVCPVPQSDMRFPVCVSCAAAFCRHKIWRTSYLFCEGVCDVETNGHTQLPVIGKY